jgi:NAD(P)H dehydrogenase (quinone)
MKKLIIVAHPNPEGFAHHMAQAFLEQSILSGHDVRIIDLYKTKNHQDFLILDTENKATQQSNVDTMQQQITRADEIVFCYPMRRYDCPAILKNRFDLNFASKFAYSYKKDSLLPYQLLKGKTARIFITGGSPKWLLLTLGLTHLVTMALARLRYCGVRLKSYTVFGSMNSYRWLHARQHMLDKVRKIAAK